MKITGFNPHIADEKAEAESDLLNEGRAFEWLDVRRRLRGKKQ